MEIIELEYITTKKIKTMLNVITFTVSYIKPSTMMKEDSSLHGLQVL